MESSSTNSSSVSTVKRGRIGWWVAAAFLLAAVVIDALDGEPLKLATSVALFIACTAAAASSPPRSFFIKAFIVFWALVSVGLLIYRLSFTRY